ncbi:hypothetical protein [Mycobacterium sp.]|jgi:small-conductance mechanosensitive channel|uniref:hypothetical protein n=1 Tax=Mycobacterium sp. TaxID=1785 RepID=UPI0033400C83
MTGRAVAPMDWRRDARVGLDISLAIAAMDAAGFGRNVPGRRRSYRHQPPPADTSPTGRETSIVTALRARLAAKDSEVQKLRSTVAQQESTIALLYGQLDERT